MEKDIDIANQFKTGGGIDPHPLHEGHVGRPQHAPLRQWDLPVDSISHEPDAEPARAAAEPEVYTSANYQPQAEQQLDAQGQPVAASGAAAVAALPTLDPAPKRFFRNLAITALVVIGVLALVSGTMGAGLIGGLTVTGIPVTTFEAGVAVGISKAIEFMTASWIGAGVVAGVAAFKTWRDGKNAAAAANPPVADTSEHDKVLALTQALEQQKTLTLQVAAAKAQPQPTLEKTTTSSETTTTQAQVQPIADPAKEVVKEPVKELVKNDGIYLPGSIIQGANFRASELKRRVEHAACESKAV